MSFLFAFGGAGLALALQAMGTVDDMKTDAGSAIDNCAAQIPSTEDDTTSPEFKAYLGCVFQQTAMQISAQLPLKVDDTSTLVAVSSEGTQFNYTYLVDMAAKDLDEGARASIERGTRQDVCADPNMADTIGFGGSFFYRWLDRSGNPIHSALISSC